jgi:hypothetical protein
MKDGPWNYQAGPMVRSELEAERAESDRRYVLDNLGHWVFVIWVFISLGILGFRTVRLEKHVAALEAAAAQKPAGAR